MATREHEDPETDYERMLDRHNLDCDVYGCWEPIRVFVTTLRGRQQYCEAHARAYGTPETTEWLEA